MARVFIKGEIRAVIKASQEIIWIFFQFSGQDSRPF